MAPPTRTEKNAAATRQAILDSGAELFARDGYANVTTGQISAHAGVTRGALYHYFDDKRDLMRGVFAEVDHALVERLTALGGPDDDAAERVAGTWRGFLDALADPLVRGIVFVEAPAALGWEEWRAIDGGRSLALVRGRLEALQQAGGLGPDRDLDVLGGLLLGALNEAGMMIAAAKRPRAARAAVEAELGRLIAGLLA